MYQVVFQNSVEFVAPKTLPYYENLSPVNSYKAVKNKIFLRKFLRAYIVKIIKISVNNSWNGENDEKGKNVENVVTILKAFI